MILFSFFLLLLRINKVEFYFQNLFNMKYLHWTPDLNTGIEEIDRQHRRIVHYINELNKQIKNPDHSALAKVVAAVVEYTESHFAFEESLLKQAGYEFTELHIKVHRLFIARINNIKQRFEAGQNVAEELHQVLSRWLFNHIRTEDHGYCIDVKQYLESQASEAELGELETLLPALDASEDKKGWLARLMGR